MADVTPEQQRRFEEVTAGLAAWWRGHAERAQALADEARRLSAEVAPLAGHERVELLRLRSLNARLADALRALYDEQNGPPLIRHEARWQAAMDDALKILQETGS